MLQLLQPLLRFLCPFRIGMFENDSLMQFLGVGNVRLPFLKLRRFKEAFRTLSATTDDQTQGEKHAYEQQCAFSKDHGKSSRGVFVQKPTLKNQSRNPSCRLAACTQEMKMGRLAPLSVILDPDACPLIQSKTLVIEDPGVFAFFFVREENDTGFPITNVGNDRFGLFSYQSGQAGWSRLLQLRREEVRP